MINFAEVLAAIGGMEWYDYALWIMAIIAVLGTCGASNQGDR